VIVPKKVFCVEEPKNPLTNEELEPDEADTADGSAKKR
jgi:hypothetical protein